MALPRRMILVLALSLMAATPAFAEHDLSDRGVRLGILLALPPDDMPSLEKQALEGDGAAMALLGECYGLAFGGLRQDDAKAANWLSRAATAGQPWARREASFFAYRSSHTAEIEAAEVALSRARTTLSTESPAPAVEPDPELVRLASDGLVEAQTLLARELASGRGASKDPTAAARWWSSAAERGEPSADATLGKAFASGEGVPTDPSASLTHYRRAADAGDVDGQTALGALYAHGAPGVAEDPVEAMKWLALAGSHGSSTAREAFATLAAMAGADAARESLKRAALWTPSPS